MVRYRRHRIGSDCRPSSSPVRAPSLKNISPRRKPANSRHCPCRQVLGNDLWQVSSDTVENHLHPTSEPSPDGGLRKRIRMHIPTWVRIRARKEPYWSDLGYRNASTPAAGRGKILSFHQERTSPTSFPARPVISRDNTVMLHSPRLTVMPDGRLTHTLLIEEVSFGSAVPTAIDFTGINSLKSTSSCIHVAVAFLLNSVR